MKIITNPNELPTNWLIFLACKNQEDAERKAARYDSESVFYLDQIHGGTLFIIGDRDKESDMPFMTESEIEA